jgi:hypothetical protein
MSQGRTASENATCVKWFSAQGQVELLDIKRNSLGIAAMGSLRFFGGGSNC